MGEELHKITLSTKLFEEKTAREKCYQYDGSADRSGPAWRSDVFDYFVSKLPAAGPWLRWAEQSTAEVIRTSLACITKVDHSPV